MFSFPPECATLSALVGRESKEEAATHRRASKASEDPNDAACSCRKDARANLHQQKSNWWKRWKEERNYLLQFKKWGDQLPSNIQDLLGQILYS